MRSGKNAEKRNGAAAAFSALAVCACLLFAAGCGTAPRYKLPLNKTLVYRVSSGKSIELDKEHTESQTSWKDVDVRVKVMQRMPRTWGLKLTALPTGGERHYALGRELGSLDLHIDDLGRRTGAIGMGLPQNIKLRLILPEFPPRRLNKGDKWKDSVDILVVGDHIQLDLDKKYEGKVNIEGVLCHYIIGTGTHAKQEEIDDPEQGYAYDMKLDYGYTEEFWFAVDGYPYISRVEERRTRAVRNMLTGEKFDKTDFSKMEIRLVGIE